jgi:hypothetical protein
MNEQQTNASKNPLLAVLEKNPLLALPLFAAIFLVGLWILPFGDLIVEGLWPYKEAVAWIILALAALVVVGREFRLHMHAIVSAGVKVHKRILKHQQQYTITCTAIPQSGPGLPHAGYANEGCQISYESQAQYMR